MIDAPLGGHTEDPGPGGQLRRALDVLPAERTPPPDALARLQQAMAADTQEAIADAGLARARVNRRTFRLAMAGAAALLTIMLASSRRRAPAAPVEAASVVLLPDEASDPRVRAVLDETRDWRVASADPVRSARWPREAREAIESALSSTETALASARGVLRQHPDNADAREAIATLRTRQLAILQRAMTLLDDL